MARRKYLMVIPEGCADRPLDDLDGQTPLAVADTPALDELALGGRLGTATFTPNGLDCTDDVTLLSMIGYDPRDHPVGFAAIEAAGMEITIPDDRWAMRLSFVNAEDDVLHDHAAGPMTPAELSHLLDDLHTALESELPEVAEHWRFYAGKDHRALLIDHADRSYAQTIIHPPAMILNEPLNRHLPTGENAELLRRLVTVTRELLHDHELNQVRRELNDPLITCCWPWGAGGPGGPWLQRLFKPFEACHDGLRGVMVCATDLAAGLARLIGWDVERLAVGEPPGRIADRAQMLINSHDLVCIHLNELDDASHRGDTSYQIERLAAIDAGLIAPLVETLQTYNAWRMLVAPTHLTRSDTGRHDPAAVPVLMAGEMVGSLVKGVYNEEDAAESDLHIAVGCELMEYFLFGAGVGRHHE